MIHPLSCPPDNYRAVIFGWDPKCAATHRWMEQMNIRSLPRKLLLCIMSCQVCKSQLPLIDTVHVPTVCKGSCLEFEMSNIVVITWCRWEESTLLSYPL